MKKILITLLSVVGITSMAHAGLVDMSDITGSWGLPNDQGVTTKDYITTIDGIETKITFSSNAGNLFAGVGAGNGIIGIIGGAGAIAGIESRGGEFLTITLTPTTASGITYTVNSGTIIGAGANGTATPEFAFTDVGNTTTYASAAVGANISSGLLAFSSAPSGLDSVSFTLRQTIETADTTEGGFLSDFSVIAQANSAIVNASEQPNIIVIFMDDLGYNDIGVQTYPAPPNQYPTSGPTPNPNITSTTYLPGPNMAYGLTPRIDSMASDGMRMTQFYSSPACSPSRAALMTGRYDRRVGINKVFLSNDSQGLNTSEVTIPELLRQEGYATGMIGKWHLGYNTTKQNPFQMMPIRHGFQEFYGFPHSNDIANHDLIQDETVLEADFSSATEEAQITWRYTEAALSYIQRHTAEDKPFYLYLAHSMTHRPCWPSDQEFTNADGTTWPKFQGSSGVSYYYDVVKEIDHSVGRILDSLDDLGIADNTVVIFTSDNGPWLRMSNQTSPENAPGSAYPLKDSKQSTWEGGCRVPFLVRWPLHIPPGSVSTEVGGLVDFLPTFVAMAGGTLPSDRTIDGVDLTGSWTAEPGWTSPRSAYALFEWIQDGNGKLDAVIKDNWKLRLGNLYDLDNDIQETVNLAASEPVIFADLQAEMTAINNSISNESVPRGEYTAYEVVLDDNDLHVPEGGVTTVGIHLSANPGKTVVVSVTLFRGDTDLSVSAGASLTFNTTNWITPQTVTLAAAQDVDGDNSGAIFRVTTNDIDPVRELFVFENDDEALPAATTSLVWPKVQSLNVSDSNTKLVAEGRVQVGAEIDPSGSVYLWQKVSGPGTVTFTDAAALETGVSFSMNGVYQLRFTADHPTAGAFDTVDFTTTVGATSSTVFGNYKYSPILAYDATTDSDANLTWQNEISPGTRDWALAAAITRTTSDPAVQLNFIDAAWNFPGGSLPAGAISTHFDAYSTGNASFELWFKPTSLPVSTPQVLWETGGDIGTSFTLDGSLIRFAVDDGTSNIINGAIASATLVPSSAQNGFVHCVGVIDLMNDQIKLYLDGSLLDTKAIASVTDWSGSSQTGLGTIADNNNSETSDTSHLGGNDLLSGSFAPFSGQIAQMLFYNKTLSAVEIADLSSGPRVSSSIENLAPVVSAGLDQSVAYTVGAALSGTASEDGLPAPASFTTLWTLYDGPENPTYGNASAPATSAMFSLPGAHTLWLEADDGEVKVYDDLVITVASYTYDEWASGITFPVGENDLLDNPDGDDWANLWEWLFGSEPLVYDSTQPYTQEVQSSSNQTVAITIQLTVPRNRQPDIALEAAESLLSGWSALSDVVPSVEILDATTERWTFNLVVNTDEIPQYFVRSRLTK